MTLLVWLQDRSSRWLLWTSAIFVFGGTFLGLFVVGGEGDQLLSNGLGTLAFIAASFSVWSMARAFERRRVRWEVALAFGLVWGLVCLVPQSLHSPLPAVATGTIAGILFICGGAFEFWRGRQAHPLAARWWLIGLFGSVAIFFVARLLLINELPFPFGGKPMRIEWMASFVWSLALASIALCFLSMLLAKESAEIELRAFAFADALTGLLNRRAFAVDAAKVARRAGARSGYSLAIFDLDNFKQINDRHGHDFGDEVLRSFARVARLVLGKHEMYRLGGEEFCCILPEMSEDAAVRIADHLRVSFRATSLRTSGHTITVTVSAGVASSLSAGTDPAMVQARADEALYRAKRFGRDQVRGMHDTDPPPEGDIGWAA